MFKKLLSSILLLFISLTFCAQQKYTIISGKIIDTLGIVKNANIININNNQGTFSNDEGLFRIFVAIGDSIQISSIQHVSQKIKVEKRIFEEKNIEIKLKLSTFILDEFELKRHNLSGRLGIDVKDVPKDKKDSLLRAVMDFSKIKMNTPQDEDYTDKRVRPQIVNVDPNSRFVGVGACVTANIPFKYSERLWALRKDLAFKKGFPYKLISELGDKFFFDDLKIPLDNYFHFLEYCNPLGIEQLHKKGKLLEVIKILKDESISYLKIIKNE